MSDPMPNLAALRAKLPAGDPAADAHEFVDELAKAGTVSEINVIVDALVDRWLEVSSDDE